MSQQEEEKEIIWSFSRANVDCLADFYQTYVLKLEGDDNAFSDIGSYCHDLVEKVGKGELSRESALETFKSGFYDAIKTPLPSNPNWRDPEGSYYEKILPWFERKEWWDVNIISVEEYLEFSLPSGRKFRGYIDRVGEKDDEVIITDYKIAKKYTGDKLKEKSKQLWMYAYGYHQVHGVYPKQMEFEYFQFTKVAGRLRYTKPSIIKFNYDEMMNTIDWIEGKIDILESKMEKAKKEKGHFLPNQFGNRDYFCLHLCSHRNHCPFVDGGKIRKFK